MLHFRISDFGFRISYFYFLHIAGVTFEVDGLAGRHAESLEILGGLANFVGGQLVVGMGVEDKFGRLEMVAIEPSDSLANVGRVPVNIQTKVEIVLGKPSGNLRR